MSTTFRLTIVHPCIGRRPGQKYIKTWQMEPLPAALIAGLTPDDVEVKLYDDRMEEIPYDEPTDLVAISIETYTAMRSYQIASEFRSRGVPVVMGGFHASLMPQEVERYAEAVVVGEAEDIWAEVIDDFRCGRPKKRYTAPARPSLARAIPDRRIFEGKRYLPIALVEAGRGCHFKCEFCAVQTVFKRTQTRRPLEQIIEEIRLLKEQNRHKLFFFVDDNVSSNRAQAKEFLRALAPLKIRWVSQGSIDAAHDEEFLELLAASGCETLLIGFESLNQANLEAMGKGFNSARGGFDTALLKLREKHIRLYATFVFGYDEDTIESFGPTVEFAKRHAFFISAFNHLTPFPGTPLYERLQSEGRLLYEKWWLDPNYSYNKIPFQPRGIDPKELQEACVAARADFYSRRSIFKRGLDPVNRNDFFMWRAFFLINEMHRKEVSQRNGYPLGDAAWTGKLLEAT